MRAVYQFVLWILTKDRLQYEQIAYILPRQATCHYSIYIHEMQLLQYVLNNIETLFHE